MTIWAGNGGASPGLNDADSPVSPARSTAFFIVNSGGNLVERRVRIALGFNLYKRQQSSHQDRPGWRGRSDVKIARVFVALSGMVLLGVVAMSARGPATA